MGQKWDSDHGQSGSTCFGCAMCSALETAER